MEAAFAADYPFKSCGRPVLSQLFCGKVVLR